MFTSSVVLVCCKKESLNAGYRIVFHSSLSTPFLSTFMLCCSFLTHVSPLCFRSTANYSKVLVQVLATRHLRTSSTNMRCVVFFSLRRTGHWAGFLVLIFGLLLAYASLLVIRPLTKHTHMLAFPLSSSSTSTSGQAERALVHATVPLRCVLLLH